MINSAKEFIMSKTNIVPEIGLILGTGLSSVSEMLINPVIIDYSDIPGFVSSTAPGHKGRLIFGSLNGKQIVIMQGRLHFYEGYTMEQITFPIRILKAIGVKTLIITNAAGSLNQNLIPGDVVIIKDHINFTGTNPLIGKNDDNFGERFPSMHEPYNMHLRSLAQSISEEYSLNLKTGIYVAVSGPSLETKSECLMFKHLGADLVGMSTVPEVIVAVHAGFTIMGISIVTNLSNIFHSESHSQEEIRQNAGKAKNKLEILIKNLIRDI